MKNALLVALLTLSGSIYSQTSLEEDDNDIGQLDISRTNMSIMPAENIEFFRLKCNNPHYAEYPGGHKQFQREFYEKVLLTADNGRYVVNGKFAFSLIIDENGEMKDLEISPKVVNSQFLLKDLQNAFRKFKSNWISAKCDGQTVPSKIRIKTVFNTENIDI